MLDIGHILIGPALFAVQFVDKLRSDDDRPLDGWIRYADSTINIDSRCGEQYARQVLWHEIVHGILDASGIDQPEEGNITAISNGIISVLQNNPELVALTIKKPVTG